MEEIKEIAIIAGLSVWALLCIYVIRRVRTINREVKAKEDAERKSLEKWEKFKAGTLHPAQVFIDNELLRFGVIPGAFGCIGDFCIFA